MKHQPHFIIERLLDQPVAPPWELAPKPLQDAASELETALAAHYDAIDTRDDTEVNIPIAQAAWDAAGKAAVRAGDPLPSRDPLDAAAFALQIAQEDERLCARKLQKSQATLGALIDNTNTRDQWRANVEKRSGELQAKFAKIASDVADDAALLGTLLSFTHYLGAWGEHLTPPGVVTVDPVGALRKLAGIKAWAPAIPINQEVQYQRPTVPDERPGVFIVNDGGAVTNVHAKDADRLIDQPGWRLATSAEVDRWHERQGI